MDISACICYDFAHLVSAGTSSALRKTTDRRGLQKMAKQRIVPKSLLAAIGALVAVIFMAVQATAAPSGHKPTDANNAAAQCVRDYLTAWTAGDYAAMHALWDSASRARISPQTLSGAFTIASSGSGRQHGDADQSEESITLKAGRISRVLQWSVRTTGPARAVADVRVEYTAGSESGVDALFLAPETWKVAQSGNADESGGWMMALACESMLTPRIVDTAAGQSKDFESKQSPAGIRLHLRRFSLVKERDGWRIANAVSCSPSVRSGVARR